MSRVLEARSLTAGYGAQPVVTEVDLHVGAGEVVALLGPNGAGKTTTLLALCGELSPLSGTTELFGQPTTAGLHRRARKGLGYVPEDRAVFKGLSAGDNLRAARCDREAALALFPELEKRLGVRGGLLSGGEQQMLALGRAIARSPKVLLADELSLGLAPVVVTRLLEAVRQAADEKGTGMLLVEQHVRKVLKYADRAYVLNRGRIVLELSAADARAQIDDIERTYLTGGTAPPAEAGPNADAAGSHQTVGRNPAHLIDRRSGDGLASR